MPYQGGRAMAESLSRFSRSLEDWNMMNAVRSQNKLVANGLSDFLAAKGLCADALDALLRLLSLDKFVEALPELLQRTDSDVSLSYIRTAPGLTLHQDPHKYPAFT